MSNEKLYTKAEALKLVYSSPLPSEFTQPLKLPVDMDISAALKMLAKLIAQGQPSYTPPAKVDDQEYYGRAVAKLFTRTADEEAEWEQKRELISRLALNGGATDAELALLKEWELLPGVYDNSIPTI